MDMNESNGLNWSGGVTILAGLWLVSSPYLFNFSLGGAGLWAQLVAGAILLATGISVLVVRTTWPSWVSGLVGLWLIATPFALNVSEASIWNELIVAVLVISMALVGSSSASKLTHATK